MDFKRIPPYNDIRFLLRYNFRFFLPLYEWNGEELEENSIQEIESDRVRRGRARMPVPKLVCEVSDASGFAWPACVEGGLCCE
jgi:hypothetical protein